MCIRDRLKPTALSRWFEKRFSAAQHANPWLVMLSQFIEELNCVWGDLSLPSSTIIDELYEFASDAARSEQGRLTLSTVHSAKGREFRHVAILDNGDWKAASDEERRLYYVGMTRARESLLLCESVGVENPFSPRLSDPGITRVPVPRNIERPEALGWRYVSLGLADVDLSFAGRKPQGHPLHKLLEQLDYDSPLSIVQTDRRIELRDPQSGQAVGALSKNCQLPGGAIVSASVDTVVRRFRKQSNPEFAHLLKVESWWVPLATLTMDPYAASPDSSARKPTGEPIGHMP